MTLQSILTVYGSGGLQELAASAGDVVLAEAYDTLGDGGGGELRFVEPEAAWTIDGLTVRLASIDGVSNASGRIQISAPAHGFEDGHRVRIEAVDASVDGDWTVTNVATDTFELLHSSYTADFGAGGTASGAILTTSADHGLPVIARVAIGGTTSFDGIYDRVFIVDTNKLAFATDASLGAGNETTGYIGDGGLQVPSTVSAGRWVRRVQTPTDVRWYGAKSDAPPPFSDPMEPYPATDSEPAFRAALAAVPLENPTALGVYALHVVAHGWFYLSDTLHITRQVLLEGMGGGDPSFLPGTVLFFPTDKTGVYVHSSIDFAFPEWVTMSSGANNTQICKMTIFCKDLRGEPDFPEKPVVKANGRKGHGVHSSAVIVLRDVLVKNFAGNGVHIAAQGLGNPEIAGNAAGSLISNTGSSLNGGHGFYVTGLDANVSLFEMCYADINWLNGFYEDGGTGNTYVACYCQGNVGELGEGEGYSADGYNHDFHIVEGVNASVLYGCYSEASRDHVYSPAGAIGGLIGEGSFVPGSEAGQTGFALSSGGVCSMGPLVSEYVHDPNGPRLEIGDSTGAKHALSFIARTEGYPSDALWWLYQKNITSRHVEWWELQSSGVYRPVLRLPTVMSNMRHPAPWMPNGIFIGRDYDEGGPIHFEAAATIPNTQGDGTAQTYEVGDVVWTNAPATGSPLGSVCVGAGTMTIAGLGQGTGSLAAGGSVLTFDDPTGFESGQTIMIDGVTGPRTIVDLDGLDAELDTPGDNLAPLTGAMVLQKVVASTTNGERDAVVNSSLGLLIGQHVTIAGLSGPLQIDGLGLPAMTENAVDGPYALEDGDTLVVKIDAGEPQTITFDAASFGGDMSALGPADVASFIDMALTGASAEATSGGARISITSDNHTAFSTVWITGGSANEVLHFDAGPVLGTSDTTHIRLSAPVDATLTDAVLDFAAPAFVPFGTTGPRGQTAGQLSIDVTAEDRSLTASQLYGVAVVKATGAPGTDRALSFPRPSGDEDAYQRTIRAAQAGGDLLVDVEDGASPITIAEGMTATIGFDVDGAYRISPDV